MCRKCRSTVGEAGTSDAGLRVPQIRDRSQGRGPRPSSRSRARACIKHAEARLARSRGQPELPLACLRSLERGHCLTRALRHPGITRQSSTEPVRAWILSSYVFLSCVRSSSATVLRSARSLRHSSLPVAPSRPGLQQLLTPPVMSVSEIACSRQTSRSLRSSHKSASTISRFCYAVQLPVLPLSLNRVSSLVARPTLSRPPDDPYGATSTRSARAASRLRPADHLLHGFRRGEGTRLR